MMPMPPTKSEMPHKGVHGVDSAFHRADHDVSAFIVAAQPLEFLNLGLDGVAQLVDIGTLSCEGSHAGKHTIRLREQRGDCRPRHDERQRSQGFGAIIDHADDAHFAARYLDCLSQGVFHVLTKKLFSAVAADHRHARAGLGLGLSIGASTEGLVIPLNLECGDVHALS